MREILVALSFVACSAAIFAESAAGLRWTAPAGWKSEGPRPMRAATYAIAPAPGDVGAAECAINYFGPGQGGSVDANIERWKSQFKGAGGKPSAASVNKTAARGLTITTIDTSGEYTGTGGPMGAAPALSGYRLLGAIVEGPGGNVFVKLTGPAKTIAANQQKFGQLLDSFQIDK